MATKRQRLVKYLEAQGAEVRTTKKGVMVRANGGAATLHHTASDRRSIKNEIQDLRRIGLIHLEDSRSPGQETYPNYVTSPWNSVTRRKAHEWLEESGYPTDITVIDMPSHLGGFDTRSKMLYHLGYRHHPRRKIKSRAIVWVAPEWVIRKRLEIQSSAQDEVEQEVEVGEQVTQGDPEPNVHPAPNTCVSSLDAPAAPRDDIQRPPKPHASGEEREFIDTVDSWVVPVSEMPDEVSHYVRLLSGAGLGVELRVWVRGQAS